MTYKGKHRAPSSTALYARRASIFGISALTISGINAGMSAPSASAAPTNVGDIIRERGSQLPQENQESLQKLIDSITAPQPAQPVPNQEPAQPAPQAAPKPQPESAPAPAPAPQPAPKPQPAPAPEPQAAPAPANPCPASAAVCVDLQNQTTWLQKNGVTTYGPVKMSSGRLGGSEETPRGVFTVQYKVKDEVSREFNNAPMPYAVYFTNTGHAFHAGSTNVRSAGCVRLEYPDAVKFFESLQVGDQVFIF